MLREVFVSAIFLNLFSSAISLCVVSDYCTLDNMKYDGHKSCLVKQAVKESYTKGRQSCKNMFLDSRHTDMVEVRDAAMTTYIVQKLKPASKFWTGLKYDYSTKKIKFSDNREEKITYTNWAVGQPSTGLSGTKCILASKTGEWETADCSGKHTVVCERNSRIVSDISCDFESYCGFFYKGLVVKKDPLGTGHVLQTVPNTAYPILKTPYVDVKATSCLSFWIHTHVPSVSVTVEGGSYSGGIVDSKTISIAKSTTPWTEIKTEINANPGLVYLKLQWNTSKVSKMELNKIVLKTGACTGNFQKLKLT